MVIDRETDGSDEADEMTNWMISWQCEWKLTEWNADHDSHAIFWVICSSTILWALSLPRPLSLPLSPPSQLLCSASASLSGLYTVYHIIFTLWQALSSLKCTLPLERDRYVIDWNLGITFFSCLLRQLAMDGIYWIKHCSTLFQKITIRSIVPLPVSVQPQIFNPPAILFTCTWLNTLFSYKLVLTDHLQWATSLWSRTVRTSSLICLVLRTGRTGLSHSLTPLPPGIHPSTHLQSNSGTFYVHTTQIDNSTDDWGF